MVPCFEVYFKGITLKPFHPTSLKKWCHGGIEPQWLSAHFLFEVISRHAKAISGMKIERNTRNRI
jgi:hypothetical protein